MNTTATPNPLDLALGARIRARRGQLGLSQDTIADEIGVTFQQVQKYERGLNRVSFSRLVAIAQALRCGVVDLIGDLGGAQPLDADIFAALGTPGAGELLTNYAAIKSPKQRQAVRDVAHQFAGLATSSVDLLEAAA